MLLALVVCTAGILTEGFRTVLVSEGSRYRRCRCRPFLPGHPVTVGFGSLETGKLPITEIAVITEDVALLESHAPRNKGAREFRIRSVVGEYTADRTVVGVGATGTDSCFINPEVVVFDNIVFGRPTATKLITNTAWDSVIRAVAGCFGVDTTNLDGARYMGVSAGTAVAVGIFPHTDATPVVLKVVVAED